MARISGLFARLVAGSAFLLVLMAPAQGSELSADELVAALRDGGFNIYFRHVATDWSQSDDLRAADDWLTCDSARMRQLSDAGRADAVAIGEAMRRLRIPVSEVLASPYCRTMETARLMRVGDVVASTDVMNLRAAGYFGGRAAIVANARRLLSTLPPPGGNRVIVAHGNVGREATPAYPAEGEGLVLQPDNRGGFSLVTRIPPARWREILNQLEQ